MRTAILFLALIMTSTFVQAVSIEQIGKLVQLNTKDDLILELVRREGLDRPLKAEDVILLREQGASDRVIDYLLNLTPKETTIMPKQEGASVWVENNIRAYHTRNKKGKPIVVVTNLDEKGKRMGPPPPPTPVVEVPPETEAPSREILVTVRHEEPPRYEDEEYMEEPPYTDPGIPYYNIPNGYYPYVSPYPFKGKAHCPKTPNGPGNYRFNWNNAPVRAPQPRVQGPVQRSSRASVAPRSR